MRINHLIMMMALALYLPPSLGFAAQLKTESVVEGDYVRLGHLFDGVENADYVLGAAPAPGQDMIINARALERIANAMNISWTPATMTEQVILRRDATVLGEMEILQAIEEALKSDGVSESFSITLTDSLSPIILPSDTPATVEVGTLSFDPSRDVFTVRLGAPSFEKAVKTFTLSGRIERTISVPVLKNSLKSGDIIGTMDLDWIDLPRKNITPDIVLNEHDLINKTPRRFMASGKPVSMNDLQSPKMVDRGDMITLVFENGPMVLTTKGKSLQAGAMGDVVRVSNMDSNKNLQGVVTAHREVTIR